MIMIIMMKIMIIRLSLIADRESLSAGPCEILQLSGGRRGGKEGIRNIEILGKRHWSKL